MSINYTKVQQIIERFQKLDPYEAYYVKDEVRMKRIGLVVPETQDVLRRALAQARRVLDVGCGDGRTLLSNAQRFKYGVGIDESEASMITAAVRTKEAKGISNVEFQTGKAVNLPFAAASFDMVFTERGPLGHCDETLIEALRVLQPRGLIFVETIGDFQTLVVERERFLRLGVSVQTAVAKRHTLVFADFYQYLKYRCAVWVYGEEPLPSLEEPQYFDQLLSEATDKSGRICLPHDIIWLAGSYDNYKK